MPSTQEKVWKLLSDHLGVDQRDIKLDSRIDEDLNADSLDVVEIVMAIEDIFNIEVSDECVEKIKTVQDIITAIEKEQENIVAHAT